MKNLLKIAVVSSETDPFSKTGGMADVTRSLSKALFRLGHSVIIITPFYEKLIDEKKFKLKCFQKNIPLKIDEQNTLNIDLWKGELMKGLTVYFIGNKQFFYWKHQEKKSIQQLYGSKRENARFALFDLAALQLLKLINFKPDIVQCNDWQTGLIPYFLKKKLRFKSDPFFKNTNTVYTIHNLAFQMGQNWWEIPLKEKDNGKNNLPFFNEPKFENINFAKRGILHSNIINTVSERYAEEILTPQFGQGMQKILNSRKKDLYGIVNGIDSIIFNPAVDKNIYFNYDWKTFKEGKKRNKLALQKETGLEKNIAIPLIGMASRVTEQKGFNLIKENLIHLLHLNAQFIILGEGDKNYRKFLEKTAKKYPHKFVYYSKFSEKMESKIHAGSDVHLMPSKFEPCGTTQLKSLRYGSIPIVHKIGGLSDTVLDFNPQTKEGNGFVFKRHWKEDLLIAITRALENYKHQKTWEYLIEKGMRQSYSWELPAKKYVALFKKAMENK
ncbi:starch synthase [Candidatus Kuenenbacteria bacterium HGW-Kuenenbacteria-1]|uniref:Glycogen synthase n=1 Tax=Candidatus Kuenenbacteria bacterium HGW-Kuenenbacteria-1 TaxID=2013812 RepID=A0A2N1UNZ1_9BACT|nr:MAG: starch synthase [Candidatus Kuenenbacteria bacterium HGW-Kuenenbacteria-1]